MEFNADKTCESSSMLSLRKAVTGICRGAGFWTGVAAASIFFVGVACAQESISGVQPPPVRSAVDANGVDLLHRTIYLRTPVISIGGASQNMLNYYHDVIGPTHWTSSIAKLLFSSSVKYSTEGVAHLCADPAYGPYESPYGPNGPSVRGIQVATAVVDGRSDTFIVCGASAFTGTGNTRFVSTEGNGSTLTYNITTGNYFYNRSDGMVAHYTSYNPCGTLIPGFAFLIDYSSANGETVKSDYPWKDGAGSDGSSCPEVFEDGTSSGLLANASYFDSVVNELTSNRGYSLRFSRASGDGRSTLGVSTYNIAINGNPLSSVNLEEGVLVSIDGSNDHGRVNGKYSKSFTQSDGAVAKYEWSIFNNDGFNSTGLTSVDFPGKQHHDMVMTYQISTEPAFAGNGIGETAVSSVLRNSVTTSYEYSTGTSISPYKPEVLVKDGDGGKTKYTFNLDLERMIYEEDPLGRITSWEYDVFGRMTRAIFAEGNELIFTYDGNGNVVSRTEKAKPGSGISDRVTTAEYWTGSPTVRNLPTTVTDWAGHRTTFTYDPTHGGVLTRTDPAVNGISPQKRFAYIQRYAWISNGGGFVHAATPIWLLSTEKMCRTTVTNTSSDSCAGGASDEVVTKYEYGPDDGSVGNNLWVRGVVVTAQDADGVIRSRRTCYGYDAVGNRISETKPRAGLGVCP